MFCVCVCVCGGGLSQVLEADDNAIENLEGLYHLPNLEEVSLKNNRILFLKSAMMRLNGIPGFSSLKGQGYTTHTQTLLHNFYMFSLTHNNRQNKSMLGVMAF